MPIIPIPRFTGSPPADGDVNRYAESAGTWTPAPGGGGAAALADLSDVDTTGAQDGDVLVRDGGQWVAGSGTSGTGILNVSGTVDLDDVDGLVEVYATASATVEGVALSAGDAAVFRYFSGAWTYMVVGEHTTWQSLALTPVTPATPTADDNADTITWTPTTGVEYVIDGQVRTSPYSVGDVTASVTVTAQATTGYTLTGTSSWTFNFTGSAPADTTNPTPGTLAVTGSGDAGSTRTLTVTGASDETALHATPYRFSTDGGTTWSAYQSSNAFTTAALAAGTYQPRVMVRDAAGNTATASAADFTLTAPPAGLPFTDTFTGTDDTDVAGRTVAGFTWVMPADSSFTGGQVVSPVINTNRAAGAASAFPSAAYINAGTNHMRVSALLTSGGSGQIRLGLGANMNPVDTNLDGMYVVYIGGEGFKVYRGAPGGGTATQVGSTYTAAGTGAQANLPVSIEWDGATVTAKVNGVTAATAALALAYTGTRAAFSLGLDTQGHAIDDFTVEAL